MGKTPKKQGPTAAENELAQVSAEQWNDYVVRFSPATKELFKAVDQSSTERSLARGAGATDAQAAFSSADEQTIATSKMSGAKVSSGKHKFAVASDEIALGRGTAKAGAATELSSEVQEKRGQMKLVNVGRDLADSSVLGFEQAAQAASSLAMAESMARTESRNAKWQAAGAVSGALVFKYQDQIKDKLFGKNLQDDGTKV